MVGQGGSLSALNAALEQADVVLWDAGTHGGALLGSLSEQTPLLALVSDLDSAVEVLRAGANGVLLRSADGQRLLAGLRAVADGLAVCEPTLVRGLVTARGAVPDETSPLTPRESEVLSLLAEGLSNKVIADRLAISDHTAKFHVNSILSKLGAETRTEAVVLAARRGILML